MKSYQEYTIQADRSAIDDAISIGYDRAKNNFAKGVDYARESDYIWGPNASVVDYTGTNPVSHQLNGELPIVKPGYRTEEYDMCSDGVSKELYPDFPRRVYESMLGYVEDAEQSVDRETRIVLLDYAKQYALTLFHASQYPMRTERVCPEHMKDIDLMGEIARRLTRAFYLDILGHDKTRIDQEVACAKQITNSTDIMERISETNPDHFKAQEMDQPLTILLSSLIASQENENIDLIYALPAGGTQHGIVTQLLFDIKNNFQYAPQLEYLPISTHSTGKKALSGELSPSIDGVMARTSPSGRHVLVCEDNSNTGTTLSLATDVILSSHPASVKASIVEFDPRRLRIKNRHPNPVSNIANFSHPDFTSGVGIVPVTLGAHPDIQMRKIASLRRRALRNNDTLANTEGDKQTYESIPNELFERFNADYRNVLKYCGNKYGYRNPYLVSATLLRHYEERGIIMESSHEDRLNDISAMSFAGVNYPYMPDSVKQALITGEETLDYVQNGPWIRKGSRSLIGSLVDYAKDAESKVYLWTKGDASAYSNPPHVSIGEQSVRYELSGLRRVFEEEGFISTQVGQFTAHPKKTRLLRTKLLPDLLSHNPGVRDVVVIDDQEKNLAEAAQAIRLYGLRPHIINPLSRPTDRAALDDISEMASSRSWGAKAAFFLDMDDTLLHERFRKFHQPRNMLLALSSRHPEMLEGLVGDD